MTISKTIAGLISPTLVAIAAGEAAGPSPSGIAAIAVCGLLPSQIVIDYRA